MTKITTTLRPDLETLAQQCASSSDNWNVLLQPHQLSFANHDKVFERAIELIGADHVGVGFDGDGGFAVWADHGSISKH